VPLGASAGPQLLPNGATHNNYALYVRAADDLIGLVAYSIYKQHKIAFLDAEIARTGKPAAQASIDTFCSMYGAPHQVQLLRHRAQRLLEEMNEELLDEAVGQINQQYQKRLVKELKEGPGWLKISLQGVLGNLVTAALVAFVLFGASSSKIGIVPTIADWAGYNAVEKSTDSAAK
jgi:hypothetical protein